MTFGTSVATCFSKYVNFQGRASRSEFWWFTLFVWLVCFIAIIIDGAIDQSIVQPIAGLALFFPSLSVQVRRLHDTDKSGGWALVGIIPLIGSIILLIMCAFKGTPGTNRFGEDPLLVHENSNTGLENN